MPGSSVSSEKLAKWIMWSMVVGIVAGLLARWGATAIPALQPALQWTAVKVLDPIGQIFLRLLFFVVVPLVFASLALGVLQLGKLELLGGLAGKTFALFTLNMAISAAIGLALMNAFEPGSNIDGTARTNLLGQFSGQALEIGKKATAQPSIDLPFLVEMFLPRNVLAAVVNFEVLPLIVFALLIGIAGTQLELAQRTSLHAALEIISQLMTRIVHYALMLAPIAVPAMLFSIVVKHGAGYLQSLGLFVVIVVAGIAIHLFGTMTLLLKIFTRRSPREFFRAVRLILVTAFSTASSNATLPTTIRVSRERLGVSQSTAGFVLPLGATMNMAGTALYEGCVVLFIAQVYGIELAISQQITLVLLAVLSAVAVAGIPGASLPVIVGLLVNFGIPAEGIALILGADRLLDMARTTLNVAADVVTAVIVDDTMPTPAGLQPSE